MKQLSLNEDILRVKVEKQVKVRNILVDIPLKYRGRAITALFPISTKKALEAINCSKIYPAEISFNKCLLNITLFDYYNTPVGPYAELALSIPVFYNQFINIPLFPLLLNNFFKNFGFFIVTIAQNTDIAIEHGNVITGYPHYEKVIDVKFKSDGEYINTEAYEDNKEILKLKINKPQKEKLQDKSYTTYFKKGDSLSQITMDTSTIMGRPKSCDLKLGNHELSERIRQFDISYNPIEVQYFSDAIEILNYPSLL